MVGPEGARGPKGDRGLPGETGGLGAPGIDGMAALHNCTCKSETFIHLSVRILLYSGISVTARISTTLVIDTFKHDICT